jgi:GT2 family glycosyltransferase
MLNQPAVDVVIAAHNEARFLAACLEALRRQDYPAERTTIFVVDNRSTDATAKIAAEHGARVLSEEKPGAAAARNRGIRAGQGDLVALLDAHCIPDKSWLALLVARFADQRLGGCQSRIDNRATDPRVQRYLEQTGTLANARVLEDTVSGKRNIYPWILSGCSVYRRSALEQAGLFNEALSACEDVDLAWRIFLLGYQLGYEPEAGVVHFDSNAWPPFIKKGLSYGRAAAKLAHAYREHGAHNNFTLGQVLFASKGQTLAALYYWLGYSWQDMRLRLGMGAALAQQKPAPVLEQFRPAFHWAGAGYLQIDRNALFWFRDDEATSVIVHGPTRTRLVLDGAGDFIWRRLVDGLSREKLIAALSVHYNISTITAAADLDEFIEELIAGGVVAAAPQR